MPPKGFGPVIKLAVILYVALFIFAPNNASAFGHLDPNRPGPYVVITSPLPDAPFKSTVGIPLSYNANDPYGISSMKECKLSTSSNGGSSWTDRGVNSGCGDPKSVTLSAAYCTAQGTNRCGVRITALDTANYTSSHEIFLTIDDTPPVISLSSNRSNPTEKTEVEFTISASDEYGVAKYECKLDQPTPRGTGNWEECVPPTIPHFNLLEGFNTFNLRVTDNAGNQTVKSIRWEIDSEAPAQVSASGLAVRATLPSTNDYFSLNLDWQAPDEDITSLIGRASSQYDIRYSVAPITNEEGWMNRTAIIYDEHRTVSPPKSPGNAETMLIGPATEAAIAGNVLGDGSNLLPAYTPLYFAIKTRDEKWNWSAIKEFSYPAADSDAFTKRDPCDYDADRVYSPNCGGKLNQCNPTTQTCDLYDDPFRWGLPHEPNQYDWASPSLNWPSNNPDEFWIRAFAAAKNDLDGDGKAVANDRIGNSATALNPPVTGFPSPGGTDWYDNPFTLDLLALAVAPTLEQLAHTINDLDLDTFVAKGWKDFIGGTEKADSDIAGTINADVDLDASKNSIAGCRYPDELFENRCTDCTAYNPDPATGRIPPNKTAPDTFQNKAVCQIEAYYNDLRKKNPPYEIIQPGTIDPAREVFSASAQCQDGQDNDLDGLTDSRQDETDSNFDVSCPTTYQPEVSVTQPEQQLAVNSAGLPAVLSAKALASAEASAQAGVFDAGGLVQCGRHADDFTTPIDESADCTFCHFFYLFQNTINLLLWRLGLVVLLLAVLWGGFLILASRGNITQVVSGRKVITIAFSAYALTFLSWAFLNTIFSIIGLMEWTGFFAERGQTTALTATVIEDNSKNWRSNQWKDYMVEIIPPKGVSGLKSSSGGQDLGSIAVPLAIQDVSWANDQWNGFELIVKSGRQQNEIRTITDTVNPNQLVLNRTVGTPSSALAVRDIININDFKQPIIRRVSANTANTLTLDSPHPLALAANPSYHIVNTGWWSFACGISAAPSANFIAAPAGGGPNLSADSEGATSYIAKSGRSSVAEPLTVYFTDLSHGDIASWAWDLDGDKNLDDSTAKSPNFSYTSENPLTITLRVTGPTGSSTKQQTINFTPQADFTAGDAVAYKHGRAPFTVTFSDSSQRATSWHWDFGDGTRDCCGNSDVTHTYYKPGPYSPRLTATGPGGSDTKVKLNYIFAYPTPNAPVASFSVATSIEDDAKLKAVFTNTSLLADGGESSPDEITHWEWDFDNNGAADSTVKNPTYYYHTNSTGYTAKLTARGPGGEHSVTQSVVFPPLANFTASARSGPLNPSGNFAVQFSDASIGTVSAWSWNFGDGGQNSSQSPSHSYTSNGAYTVTLTARHPGQTDSTETKTSYIVVTPGAYFAVKDNPSGTGTPISEMFTDGTAYFDNQSRCTGCSWVWEFGDGTVGTSRTLFGHSYANEVYKVHLTATDGDGRSNRAGPSTLKVWANPKFKLDITNCTGSLEGAPPTGTIDCKGKYSETLTITNQATTHANIKQWKWEMDDDDSFSAGSIDWTGLQTRPGDSPASNFNLTRILDISSAGEYSMHFLLTGAAVGETGDSLGANLKTITPSSQNGFVDFTPIASLSVDTCPANYSTRDTPITYKTITFDARDSQPNQGDGGTAYAWTDICEGETTDFCTYSSAACDNNYTTKVKLTNNGGNDESPTASCSWACEQPACMTYCADSDHGPDDTEHYEDSSLCTFTANLCGDSKYVEFASCAISKPARRDDSKCKTLINP